MNVLTDDFFFYKKRDGSVVQGCFLDILDPDVLDFAMPREDFQVSAYVFTIAVLQTIFAPEDKYEWWDRFEMQVNSPEELKKLLIDGLNNIQHAFNVIGNGPLIMQDFDLLLESKEQNISTLLIESPGENTIKNNTDHFIKRDTAQHISLPMVFWALFTLQSMAPSGGVGYRVSLRGGGPLTTIILSANIKASLWQNLWLNVISRKFWSYPDPDFKSVTLFPWLGPTKESKSSESAVYAKDIHPLGMYWAMPRRIRINEDFQQGICQISGLLTEQLVSSFRAQNYGYNYSGTWSFPLTPYRWNPKKPDEDRLSIKGQPGGLHYNQWHILAFSDSTQGFMSAQNIQHYYELPDVEPGSLTERPRIWASGYDMDNMKARGWVSAHFPLMDIKLEDQDDYLKEVTVLQNLARNIAASCRTAVKEALISERSKVKGGFDFVETVFWQGTQADFYNIAQDLLRSENYFLTKQAANRWFRTLRDFALVLFDEYVLSGDVDASLVLLEARVKARQKLYREIYFKNKIFLNDYKLTEEA